MISSPSLRDRVRFVDTPGARLAVHDSATDGEPLVMLHGGPGCPDYLQPVADLLAPTHRTVTFDQRGVGASVTLDGRFGIDAYLADLEAVRSSLGITTWHIFGHSWGGLLAQLYARAYPNRVRSLFLSSPSLGVGPDWRRTQRAALQYNRRQSGPLGFLALGLWSILLTVPGPVGQRATANLFRRVWRNYFPNPRQAPPADAAWLRGVNGRAMAATADALARAAGSCLPSAADGQRWPVLVLFGEQDIYGDEIGRVFCRFPAAEHIVLPGSGHLPWLQAPAAFATLLRGFYEDPSAAIGAFHVAEVGRHVAARGTATPIVT
jgi:proline iminopeptidase